MLSLEACRDILQANIDEQNFSADRKLALLYSVQEGEFCFAFTVNSAKFVETGNFDYFGVGGGPTLVDRRDGKVIEMSNMGTMKNYEKRGDPYNGLSGILHVTGGYSENMRQDAFKYIRSATDRSISDCRDILDKIMRGETFVFDTKAWRSVDVPKYVDEFRALGFNVKRLTTFEARDAGFSDKMI